MISPSSVPPTVLKVAYTAGSAILEGTPPDSLPNNVFTETFLHQYKAGYKAFILAMSTTDITWTGTPVVTWTGRNLY